MFHLLALYWLGANLFLNLWLRGLINTNPESLLVRYELAISPFPGVAYVNKALVRNSDSSVQFTIDIESAWLLCNVFALHKREFHVKRIHTGDVAFRMRMVRDPKEVKPELTQTLPALEGLDSYARKPEPAQTEDPVGNPKAWKVRFENVRIRHANEIWVEQYRYSGNATIRGGFYLWPKTEVIVYPSDVRANEGDIFLGANRFAGPLMINLETQITRFFPKDAPGMEPFNYADAKLEFHAPITNIAFLNFYLRGVPWLRLDDGEGHLDAHLGLARGKFTDGSRLDLRSDNLKVDLPNNEIVGKADVSWKVEENQGTLGLRFVQYEFFSKKLGKSVVDGTRLSIDVRTPQLVVSKDFSPMYVEIDLPQGRVTDLTYINTYLPRASQLVFQKGKATFDAHFDLSTVKSEHDRGKLLLSATDTVANYKDMSFGANFVLSAILNGGKVLDGKMDFKGTEVKISKLTGDWISREKDDTEIQWCTRITVTEGKIGLTDPAWVKGKLDIQGKDAIPFTYLFMPKNGPGWIRNLLALEGLKSYVELEANDDDFTIEHARIQGDGTKILGWYRRNPNLQEGKVLLERGPLAAGLQIIGDDVSVKLHDAIEWYAKHASPPPTDVGIGY